MQSTGHTSTQAVSLTPTHGSAMMCVIDLLSFRRVPTDSLYGPQLYAMRAAEQGRVKHDTPTSRAAAGTWRWRTGGRRGREGQVRASAAKDSSNARNVVSISAVPCAVETNSVSYGDGGR